MIKNNPFKLNKKNIIITILIFLVLAFLQFPVKMDVQCKTGVPCPAINTIVTFPSIFNDSFYVEINYIFLLIELLISYLISSLILYSLNKTNKK